MHSDNGETFERAEVIERIAARGRTPRRILRAIRAGGQAAGRERGMRGATRMALSCRRANASRRFRMWRFPNTSGTRRAGARGRRELCAESMEPSSPKRVVRSFNSRSNCFSDSISDALEFCVGADRRLGGCLRFAVERKPLSAQRAAHKYVPEVPRGNYWAGTRSP